MPPIDQPKYAPPETPKHKGFDIESIDNVNKMLENYSVIDCDDKN